MTQLVSKSELSHLLALRAIDELRRQSGFFLTQGAKQFAVFPVVFLNEEKFTFFQQSAKGKLKLVIAAPRAKSLGLSPEKEAFALDASSFNFKSCMAICDPTLSAAIAPVSAAPVDNADVAALMLAKYSAILPGLLVFEASSDFAPHWLSIPLEAAMDYIREPALEVIETARAALPLDGADNTSLVSFRASHSSSVHLALVIGDISKVESPLTRIHSSCVTGDILGSLRCDCGDQLQGALNQIIHEGAGILLYLHQEGRGIGITNKIRAYKLQEQGVDTFDANLMLGFEEDERDFSIAASMLKLLGVKSIRLLTNNPEKLDKITKAGIAISQRVPLITKPGRHNHAYIEAKGKKAGHLF